MSTQHPTLSTLTPRLSAAAVLLPALLSLLHRLRGASAGQYWALRTNGVAATELAALIEDANVARAIEDNFVKREKAREEEAALEEEDVLDEDGDGDENVMDEDVDDEELADKIGNESDEGEHDEDEAEEDLEDNLDEDEDEDEEFSIFPPPLCTKSELFRCYETAACLFLWLFILL